MLEIHEIENYEAKKTFLESNGWTSLWHVDNWVREEWFNHPTINVDLAGISTDKAYATAKKEYNEVHLKKIF
jgi:hypothetical protein